MPPRPLDSTSITRRIHEIALSGGATTVAVSLYDYEPGLSWGDQGDRWFHAASTIKVAVLYGPLCGD